MPRTIGLDFGTHQSKVCVEEKDRFETRYSFVSFTDNKGRNSYVLPSIIRINEDGKLSYGYVEEGVRGKIVRYFKQATFTDNSAIWKNDLDADYYTIWYLAYILFILEDKYDDDFSINFGIPTDNDRYDYLKAKAVSLLLSAYRLVEDVYHNDIEEFLDESIKKLLEKTDILSYSEEKKDYYNILVFPEAYACLRPLATRGKIATGMNLMIDIGGGTTDISFFTMEKNKPTDQKEMPQMYEMISIPKGLNFLTKAEESLDSGKIDSIVDDDVVLDWFRLTEYVGGITKKCYQLRQEILNLFGKTTKLNKQRLKNALKNRLVIFTGGGSTFRSLRRAYGDFSDIKHITISEWGTYSFEEMDEISKLCPILSTAFGLSISAATDKYNKKKLHELFLHLKDEEENEDIISEHRPRSYKDDWMNKDYGVLDLSYTYSHSNRRKRSTSSVPSQPYRKPTNYTTNKSLITPSSRERISPVDPRQDVPGPLFKVRLQQRDNSTNQIQNGVIPFYNIPFNLIGRDGLKSQERLFTVSYGIKVRYQCYGKVIIDNGYPYDIYIDNRNHLVIDALHFTGPKVERRAFIAVDSISPLYQAVKTYGAEKIIMIQGNGKKKTGNNVRVSIEVPGSTSIKRKILTYKLVQS